MAVTRTNARKTSAKKFNGKRTGGWRGKKPDGWLPKNEWRKKKYDGVNAAVIAAIDSGILFSAKTGGLMSPANIKTKELYTGCNVLALLGAAAEKGYTSSGWIGRRQAEKIGGAPKPGEEPSVIVKYDEIPARRKEDEFGDEDEEEDEDGERKILIPKFLEVFNFEQMFWMETPDTAAFSPKPPDFAALAEMAEKTGVNIKFGGSRVFYMKAGDFIRMPKVADYERRERFFHDMFRCLTRWAGHPSRLGRELDEADEAFAAEIASAFILSKNGVQPCPLQLEHKKTWLERVGNDTGYFRRIAFSAMKAAEFIEGKEQGAAAVPNTLPSTPDAEIIPPADEPPVAHEKEEKIEMVKDDKGDYLWAAEGFLIEIYYRKDAYSYTHTGKTERGIVFSVTPGRRYAERGFMVTQSSPTEGVSACIVPLSRKNQKKMDSVALEINEIAAEVVRISKEDSIRNAVEFVYNKYRG